MSSQRTMGLFCVDKSENHGSSLSQRTMGLVCGQVREPWVYSVWTSQRTMDLVYVDKSDNHRERERERVTQKVERSKKTKKNVLLSRVDRRSE